MQHLSTKHYIINEADLLIYYALLISLREIDMPPHKLAKFRFSSIEESTFCNKAFLNLPAKKQLFFYALYDEINFLLHAMKKQRFIEKHATPTMRVSFLFRIAIIGYLALRIANHYFVSDNIEGAFKELGKAYKGFLIDANNFATKLKGALYIDPKNDILEYTSGIVRNFTSDSLHSGSEVHYAKFYQQLQALEKSGIRNMMFSLFSMIKGEITGETIDPNHSFLKVMFCEGYPLWTHEDRDGSYFSYLFLPLLNEEDRRFVRFIELSRLYLLGKESENKGVERLRKNTVLFFINKQKEKAWVSAMSDVADAVLAGEDGMQIRDAFLGAINYGTIEFAKDHIRQIVRDEASLFRSSIRQQAEAGEEVRYEEAFKLMFVNLFNAIYSLLDRELGFVYAEFSAMQKRKMRTLLSSIVKEELYKLKEEGLWQ